MLLVRYQGSRFILAKASLEISDFVVGLMTER